uniref:Uncharacterized protein n=1 Tax=Leersia perrieri TaxID=77586 RepID=A0A0D9X1J3_9ORYZ
MATGFENVDASETHSDQIPPGHNTRSGRVYSSDVLNCLQEMWTQSDGMISLTKPKAKAKPRPANC